MTNSKDIIQPSSLTTWRLFIVWTVLFNRICKIIRDFVSIVTNELTMTEKVLSAIVYVLIFA